MGFRDDEIGRIIEIRNDVFGDPGGGVYRGLEREFVLKNPMLNLWDEIREDAPRYFERNRIV